MTVFEFFFRAIRVTYNNFFFKINHLISYIKFKGNGVNLSDFNTNGIPYILVSKYGSFKIDKFFKMNNGLMGNPIGRPQPCTFVVDNYAYLEIGKNVGMSSTAIVCHSKIIIGDNVKIGGGTCIYDTDFHALDSLKRLNKKEDKLNKIDKPIFISDNVFIGAHSTILKGVTIGSNSIVGACSVVTKNIPPNEIWAGNPVRFIKKNES